MDELHAAIAAVAAMHHRDRIFAAAAALRSSRSPDDTERARTILGAVSIHGSGDPLGVIISICRKRGKWDPASIASALEGAAAAIALLEERQSIEIAWTGPAPNRTALRRTEQVIRQVVDSARSHIWLVSFVVYDPQGIADSLLAAVERGVAIHALLESPQSRGGTLESDPAAHLGSIIPGVRFYEWPKCPDRGCIHAKCVIADGRMAFVTSANLTGAALERNMELGVLIRGGSQPAEMDEHLRLLLEEGLITKLAT